MPQTMINGNSPTFQLWPQGFGEKKSERERQGEAKEGGLKDFLFQSGSGGSSSRETDLLSLSKATGVSAQSNIVLRLYAYLHLYSSKGNVKWLKRKDKKKREEKSTAYTETPDAKTEVRAVQ